MGTKTFAEWLAENPTSGPLSIAHNAYVEETKKAKPKAEDKPKAKDKTK
jgi:hypothetical protein